MTTHHTGPAASTGAADAPLRSTRPPKLERDLFIGNQWRPGSTGQTIGLVNPATEQPFGRAAAASADDVDAAVQAARTATGRKIAASAAATLKHVSLELGGKAAALVLDDAPLPRLVETMTPAILFNDGQMCIQPARLIVPEHRQDEIVAAFAEAFAKVVVGPPDAPGTELGPLVGRQQYDHAMGLLQSAKEDGGTFVTGGGRPPGLDTGFYVAPTIITDVSPRSRVGQEEIFAPVMVVFTYTSEEEALQIVNDTEYGLSDAVYSADADRALAIARRMQSGTININNGMFADPAIPFGGVKQSGYGQENGPEGLDIYFETHVIYLDAGPFQGMRRLKPATVVQTSV